MDLTISNSDQSKNTVIQKTALESYYDDLRINMENVSKEEHGRLANVFNLVKQCGKVQHTATVDSLYAVNGKVRYNNEKILDTDQSSISNIKEQITNFLNCENITNKKDRRELSIELFNILTSGINGQTVFAREQLNSPDAAALSMVYGSSGSAARINESGLAVESYGINTDNLAMDLTMSIRIAVQRQVRSIMDRMFPRKTVSQPVVTFGQTYGEVYDLHRALSQVSKVRTLNRTPLINTYDIASHLLDTTPVRCVLLPENDPENDQLYEGHVNILKANNNTFDLMQLSRDSKNVGFTSIDHTDLLSEAGGFSKVLVLVKSTTGIKDLIEINIGALPTAQFAQSGSSEDSSINNIYVNHPFALNSDSPIFESVLKPQSLSGFTEYTIAPTVNISANISLKNGQGTCSANIQQKNIRVFDNATNLEVEDPAHPIMSVLKTLTIEVVGIEPVAYFSEENLKRSMTMLRINTRQIQLSIPAAKSIIIQSSIFQTSSDDKALSVVGSALTTGNDIRGLHMINSKMDDVLVSGKNYLQTTLSQETFLTSSLSVASNLSRPYIYEDVLDLTSSLSIANIKENELMCDVHAKIYQLFTKAAATVFARTLFLTNLDNGEVPQFSVHAHTYLVDILIYIKNYHASLDDTTVIDPNSKADITLLLPNGTRLNIYKSYFLDWETQFRGYVVRQNPNPDDIVNYATTYDVGTLNAEVTLNNINNGTAKSFISNSRVSPLTTNPGGFNITVKGAELLYSRLNLLPQFAQSLLKSKEDNAQSGNSTGTGTSGTNTGTGTSGTGKGK